MVGEYEPKNFKTKRISVFHTTTEMEPKKVGFVSARLGKLCCKMVKCWLPGISPFLKMFSKTCSFKVDKYI